MSPTHTRKNGRLYRYYVSQTAIKQGYDSCPMDGFDFDAVGKPPLRSIRLNNLRQR